MKQYKVEYKIKKASVVFIKFVLVFHFGVSSLERIGFARLFSGGILYIFLTVLSVIFLPISASFLSRIAPQHL